MYEWLRRLGLHLFIITLLLVCVPDGHIRQLNHLRTSVRTTFHHQALHLEDCVITKRLGLEYRWNQAKEFLVGYYGWIKATHERSYQSSPLRNWPWKELGSICVILGLVGVAGCLYLANQSPHFDTKQALALMAIAVSMPFLGYGIGQLAMAAIDFLRQWGLARSLIFLAGGFGALAAIGILAKRRERLDGQDPPG